MRKVLLSLVLAIASLSGILAQPGICGTPTLMESSGFEANSARIDALIKQAAHGKGAAIGGTILIPTVFHVVYNTPNQNIPDSLIYQQLQILNDDFQRKNADTVNTPAAFQSMAGRMNIEFCLAQRTPAGMPTTGIVRVPTGTTIFNSPTTYSVPDPVKHSNQGGSDAWDTNQYLNIWVCNLNGSTAYSAPPGNFMPDDEGIVCRYEHVGNTGVYPYNHGRTIVHEAGHYFCLKHIWGDDQGACTGTDYINDTPNQANYSTNCPTFPKTDACSPNSPGVMFMNYMDYTEDGCRNMFSAGQCAYMQSCLTSLRPGLLSSMGCVPLVGLEAEQTPNPTIRRDGDWIVIESEGQGIARIEMMDMQGRSLLSHQNLQGHRLYAGDLAIGIYCLRVHFDHGHFKVWKVRI